MTHVMFLLFIKTLQDEGLKLFVKKEKKTKKDGYAMFKL